MPEATAKNAIKVKAQNGLRKREVEKFLRLLQLKREEIVGNLSKPPSSIGNHSDPNDLASSHESLHFEEGRRLIKRSELKEVDAAIARISAGTFGKCYGPDRDLDNEECTGKISPDLLRDCPTLDLCQNCMKELRSRSGERKHPGGLDARQQAGI